MFHAVPLGIGDPFLYLEDGERRVATVSVLEADKVSALGIEVIDPATLGSDELIATGMDRQAIEADICVRACRKLGIAAADVPPEFPIFAADALREAGVSLSVDAGVVAHRRRHKTGTQLAGAARPGPRWSAAAALRRRPTRRWAPPPNCAASSPTVSWPRTCAPR